MAGKGAARCGPRPARGDNGLWVSVSAGEVAEAHLERRSRLPGYCIVVWRHGHVAEPGDLEPAQAGRYRAEVFAAGRAVRARFKPVTLNDMTPGNTVPHVHPQVLPRDQDDPAPGGPIAWEAIFAADPVPEAGLHRQAADLRGLPVPDRERTGAGACRGRLGAGPCCEPGVATHGGLRRRRCQARADAA